jgi:GTP-binding protein
MNPSTVTQPQGGPHGLLPVVAIVGRPNVGKSMLFNRLVGGRLALVEDLPGTTRDRLYGTVDWRKPFRLIDTGGLEAPDAGGYPALIRLQIEVAISEATAILFVVDTRDGVTAADEEVADLLRRSSKPVVLVANKADNPSRVAEASEFWSLGYGEPVAVSAYHDSGIADLLDRLSLLLPDTPIAEEDGTLGVAIIGRPNVGKSALLNAILGEERVIVSNVPGTTRDAIDTPFSFDGRALTLIDTAGIRRRGAIEAGVERHSVARAQDAVTRADVSLVVMDAHELLTAQDMHIIEIAEQAGTALVVVINKVDLLEQIGTWRDDLRRLVRARLKFAPWAPVVFVSALRRQGLEDLLRTAVQAGERRALRVSTPQLNAVVRRALVKHAPPTVRGKKLNVLYVTQAERRPPTFVFFVNDPAVVHFTYKRYLENVLRETFDLRGTPVRLIFRGRSETA